MQHRQMKSEDDEKKTLSKKVSDFVGLMIYLAVALFYTNVIIERIYVYKLCNNSNRS